MDEQLYTQYYIDNINIKLRESKIIKVSFYNENIRNSRRLMWFG